MSGCRYLACSRHPERIEIGFAYLDIRAYSLFENLSQLAETMAKIPVFPARLAIALTLEVGGCATHVPQMQKLGEPQAAEAVREGNLVSHIKCELHKAVQDILEAKPPPDAPAQVSVDWLRTWGAKASLKLVIDEKAGVAPGLTFTNPLHNVVRTFASGGNVTASQSQNTALAASLTSDATRTETIGFTYAFRDLLAEKRITQACSKAEGMLIDGDLHIKDFMVSKILAARVPGLYNAAKAGDSPFTTFTYEVTFVVSSGGSGTPSWKLAQVSANPAGTFVSGSRTRTSDLILTLGAITTAGAPSSDVQDAHLADLIGRAVAQSISSRQP